MIPNHQAASAKDLRPLHCQFTFPRRQLAECTQFVPVAAFGADQAGSAAAGEWFALDLHYASFSAADRPAHTASTYYNRPGNGCSLHHDTRKGGLFSPGVREAPVLPGQLCVQRSATRGVPTNRNAVPPLLRFPIADALGRPGDMIDVFAGAGGLSLGFKWKGWRSPPRPTSTGTSLKLSIAMAAPARD